MAVGHFRNSDRRSWVLLLTRGTPTDRREQIILIDPAASPPQVILLMPEKETNGEFAIWRLAPGVYEGFDRSNAVRTRHDSILYIDPETSSTLFYFASGKVHSLLLTD